VSSPGAIKFLVKQVQGGSLRTNPETKMRYSLPIALALAAVTVAGASGTATAFNNNSNPWTAPLFKDEPIKPPKANTHQNPSATQSTTNSATPSKPPKANSNQNPSATQTAVPNSSTSRTSSNPRNRPNPTPAADLKKDIAKQTQDIKKYEGYIAELQQMKPDAIKYVSGPRIDSKLGPTICDSSGCTRMYKTMSFGGPGVTINIRVDAKGNLLPGEFDKMVNAVSTAIDKAIDANIRRVADAKQQIQADYAANPQMLGGGTVQAPRSSTALHQD
jgi:hypothetical protein